MSQENDDLFNDNNKVKVEYNNIKFGKVGDWFKGTLTENTRQIKNQLSKTGEMQTVFEFKAHGGSLHLIEKRQVQADATIVPAGEFWSFITGKPAIVKQLKAAQLGQIVGLKLSEIKPATQPGFDDTKIISVYVGNMDPEYQGETSADNVPH